MHAARTSGILLHLTSLPGPHGSGDFGAAAYHFVDWLKSAGQGLWQLLPLNPAGPGHSPYMSPSAFAIDPQLIDLADLVQRGWLDADLLERQRHEMALSDRYRIDFARVVPFRMQMLKSAAQRFLQLRRAGAGSEQAQTDRYGDVGFMAFCDAQADWLDDYALFMAIAERWPQASWADWPSPLARRIPEVLNRISQDWADDIEFWKFSQWIAHRQWQSVKRYANDNGVRIVGDVPIFIAPHSADVWAHPELFDLTPQLQPRVVAGVPPDYFSATGQLWGNPLYRWARHHEQGFAWWIARVRACLQQADIVRIDHFRGFAEYWEVAADAATAATGTWRPGPAAALFEALQKVLGELPIIAEDLGVITPDVTALRQQFRLPGMRVLQFAFGDDAGNAYLPHNYEQQTVVYTGTHDNDTSAGWFAQASAHERGSVQTYLKSDGSQIGWDLIHCASQSVAAIAIYPLQDVLDLGSEARMNRPGVADGCWNWRFDWDQVLAWHGRRLSEISMAHGRQRN